MRCNSRVSRVLLDGDRAVGVALADGEVIQANAVISNADIEHARPRGRPPAVVNGPPLRHIALLHLHLGFDASGLEDLPIHTVGSGLATRHRC